MKKRANAVHELDSNPMSSKAKSGENGNGSAGEDDHRPYTILPDESTHQLQYWKVHVRPEVEYSGGTDQESENYEEPVHLNLA